MSERVVWRAFFDFEKEERWLNEMAAGGWEMTGYTWCRYTFAKGSPGRYIYRLQLLPNSSWSQQSKEYLRFLEDAGVELVDSYSRWVYIRKTADGGPFDLFSDRESRLAHHKRVAGLFGVVAAAQLPLLSVSLVNVTAQVQDNVFFSMPLVAAQVALIVGLSGVALRQYATVRRLEREAAVHE